MEFDKSKVYTALNDDGSLIGAKGYFAESLCGLIRLVKSEYPPEHKVKCIDYDCIIADNCDVPFNFFYLVEPAPKKWYVRQSKITGKYLEPNEWSVDSDSAPCVFSGTKEECNQYILEHSKPKYRPFKDTDELISYFCHKYSISKTNWGLPFIWVKDKAYENRCLVTEIYRNAVLIGSYNETTHLSELFEDYTFLDGSPCGVEC